LKIFNFSLGLQRLSLKTLKLLIQLGYLLAHSLDRRINLVALARHGQLGMNFQGILSLLDVFRHIVNFLIKSLFKR